MALQWVTETSLRGPKGDKGDPGDPAPGGSYLSGPVPAGQATVSITHNLGTRDVVVMVRETSSYAYVPIANDAPNEDTVRLQFAEPPTTGQYRYVVFAALGDPVPGPVAPTAHAPTHAAGGADPLTPAAIGAAPDGHTHNGYAASDHAHPNMPGTLVGPWVTRSFSGSGLSAGPKNAGATITVPDPGFDWRPHCFAQYYFRCDISGTQTGLELQLDGGDVYARGIGAPGPLWGIAAAHPVPGPVLPAGRSWTFRTVVFPLNGGGWLEATTAYDPFIMIYAIPA